MLAFSGEKAGDSMRGGLILATVFSMAPMMAAHAAEPALDALSPRVSNDCELRTTSTDPAETCWTLVCASKPPESLGCGITAMSQVAEFAVSPDARWLAVVSVGEGHPWLEVVPLKPLLRQHRYRARVDINPYPGTVQLVGWRDGELEIDSDMPIDRASAPQDAIVMPGDMRRFRVDPQLGLVTAIRAQAPCETAKH